MNIITLVIAIIIVLIMAIVVIFFAFTRQGKNIIVKLFQNKKYVVCHLKRDATDFVDIHNIVVRPDYLTKVGKFDYDLNPNYAILKFSGRLHFLLHEGDVVPQYIKRKDTNEEILIQVQEVRTALHNTAYDWLYRKKQNIALLIAFAALALTIIVAVYAAYEISKVNSLLEIVASTLQNVNSGNTIVVK